MPQTWDPAEYARVANFVPRLGAPLLELLAPRAGERVLDLGCGDGTLSAALAERGCEVVGIDSSPAQVAAARARGIDAREGDAQALAFDAVFDAVFSNAALHWMPRQDLVLAGAARALRPGGRFVGELGAAGNIAQIRAALHAELAALGLDAGRFDPWTFPAAETFRAALEGAGFGVDLCEVFVRPTRIERELGDWLELMARCFIEAVPPESRPGFIDRVSGRLRAPLFRDGTWQLDYVRLRFVARLEA